jgi:DNA-binding beta-propeller fold protein YncE
MVARVRMVAVVLFGMLGAAAGVAQAAQRREYLRSRPGLMQLRSSSSAGTLAHDTHTRPHGSGSAVVGTTPTGNGPSQMAVDPLTHTIYVANGSNNNGPNAGGDTISVIDSRRCNAHDVSRCPGPWPTITVGQEPDGVAIDPRTDTVYVANVFASGDSGAGSVSVINGATCNAEHHVGCGHTLAMIPVGYVPAVIFLDPANHTLYVPNLGAFSSLPVPFSSTVSMIDTTSCNAQHPGGCPRGAPPTVDVGSGSSPTSGAVDPATHTVYITTIGNQNGWTVLDANTCNAETQTACGTQGFLPGDSSGPFDAVVDDARHTLYTANFDNTISAFDLDACNAGDLGGCATDTPGTVSLAFANFGNSTLGLTLDPDLHTLYVVYFKSDELVAVDTNACNGGDPTGCAALNPPQIHTGTDTQSVALDPQSQTLYASNELDGDLTVIDPTRCNAVTTIGCRTHAPEIPIGAGSPLAADPGVDTVYTADGADSLQMINTSRCNAFATGGCSTSAPAVTVGANPDSVAVDPLTHTVYVSHFDTGSTGTVSVFGDGSCNSTVQSGCGGVATLNVPDGIPDGIDVNLATDTVYVATIASSGPNLITVFNGATCNAGDMRGCGQIPAAMPFADSGGGASNDFVAVDAATNTIYATNVVFPPFNAPFVGHSVYVLNGAHCDGADMTGCGATPASVTLNPLPSNPFGVPGQEVNPFGVAVDEATDTVYTANLANGEGPGTVSVIDGATCSGTNHSGCGQTPATAPAGFGTNGIAVDQTTNHIYATNTEDTSVTTIDGHTCNATNPGGCDKTLTRAIVGDYPGAIAVDHAVSTVYVSDAEGVSMIPLAP